MKINSTHRSDRWIDLFSLSRKPQWRYYANPGCAHISKMALVTFLAILESLGAAKSRSIKRQKMSCGLPGVSSRIIGCHFCKVQQVSGCHKHSRKAWLARLGRGFCSLSPCSEAGPQGAFQQLVGWFSAGTEFSNIASAQTCPPFVPYSFL